MLVLTYVVSLVIRQKNFVCVGSKWGPSIRFQGDTSFIYFFDFVKRRNNSNYVFQQVILGTIMQKALLHRIPECGKVSPLHLAPLFCSDTNIFRICTGILCQYFYLFFIFADALLNSSLHFEASRLGGTVIRPLFFEFPRDPGTFDLGHQFMWGSGMMIIPVLEKVLFFICNRFFELFLSDSIINACKHSLFFSSMNLFFRVFRL